MLTRSFIFLRGMDSETERRWWKEGILTWQRFHENIHDLPFSPRQKYRWQKHLWKAEDALNRRDALFFERYLPPLERWRMLSDFREETAYLDVEAYQHRPGQYQITLVGLLFQQKYEAFIRGYNLETLPAHLKDVKFLVTFGGQSFDLRILEDNFLLNDRNFAVYDFQPVFKILGLPQGLKKLERLFGWRRGSGLDGLSGWVAVHLWEMHQEGDDRALQVLIRYNYEDVIHLPYLSVYAYNQMVEKYHYPFRKLPLPRYNIRVPSFDRSVIYDVKRRFFRKVQS